MLIVSAIMLALFHGNAFAVLIGFRSALSSLNITARGLEVTRAFLPLICLSSFAAILVLGVATFFYLRHPLEIRRRRKIRSISEKDREIQNQVNELAFQAGVKAPQVEIPPEGFRGTDAQAFGIGKSPSIALDGGFRILRRTNLDVFTALIRHELAHFANADISRSYFSNALWKSIRWIIVLPVVVVMVERIIVGLFLGVWYGDLLQRFTGPTQFIFGAFVQFVYVVAMAAWIWGRLLRTREFYADWRAILWGSRGGLTQIFQEQIDEEKPKAYFALWRLHPDAKERMSAIEHPETLFKHSPIVIFLAGSLLALLFVGIYFSFATFLAFAGVLQTIRDSTTGFLYWLARGTLWFGIASLILLIFGGAGWLINGVLLPQIQKQTILDLLNKQDGLIQYIKMGIPAFILVAGVELGFFMAPSVNFAPTDLWGMVLEIFVIVPMLILTAWWYLIYVRFVSRRVSATQTGKNFSVWRNRFMQTASASWGFLLFIPGLFLSRYLTGELVEIFLYFSLIWLASTLLLGVIMFGATWVIIRLFFENQPQKCPHCGKVTRHREPAIEFCEHCEGVLGEWLFVPENL
jgi:Zn-dependent protease with chaperone function